MDGNLKRADRELSHAAEGLRNALTDNDRLTFDADQARWLQSRMSCVDSENATACLSNMYRARFSEIRSWPKSNRESAASAVDEVTEGEAIRVPEDLSAPARLRNIDTFITPDDYPAKALHDEEQGNTTVRFEIDERGRVSNCLVTASSGSRALDEQTCSLITRRARFDPARSASGLPIRSTATRTIRWTLP
jgi:TonB family protein